MLKKWIYSPWIVKPSVGIVSTGHDVYIIHQHLCEILTLCFYLDLKLRFSLSILYRHYFYSNILTTINYESKELLKEISILVIKVLKSSIKLKACRCRKIYARSSGEICVTCEEYSSISYRFIHLCSLYNKIRRFLLMFCLLHIILFIFLHKTPSIYYFYLVSIFEWSKRMPVLIILILWY